MVFFAGARPPARAPTSAPPELVELRKVVDAQGAEHRLDPREATVLIGHEIAVINADELII